MTIGLKLAQPSKTKRSSSGVVLFLLLLSYTFSYIDRSIIGILGQAIKADLKITDTQLGLLGGFYFALLYTGLGIPIARLAERYSRVNIIAVSMVIWSAFTAACGAAGNFATLAFCRFGVGFGEAGCSPPAHSLISDYFPPERRSFALSIYSLGLPLGAMFGALAGGWLAQTFSWRVAFVAIGLPGIAVALAIKLWVKEPRVTDSLGLPPLIVKNEVQAVVRVAKELYQNRPVLHMMIGMTLGAFVIYGVGQFAPAFFLRVFDLSLAQAGMVTGLIGGLSAAIGTLAGGYFSDRLGARSRVWYALLPALGLFISVPIYIFAYSIDSWQWAAATLLLPGIFSYLNLGPTFAAVQNSVGPTHRATATAILFLFVNMVALAGGPVFVGLVIDRSSDYLLLASPGAQVWDMMNHWGAFQIKCPGGMAPAGSSVKLAEQCGDVLGAATRIGLVTTVCVYLWASLHYFIAAAKLKREGEG